MEVHIKINSEASYHLCTRNTTSDIVDDRCLRLSLSHIDKHFHYFLDFFIR